MKLCTLNYESGSSVEVESLDPTYSRGRTGKAHKIVLEIKTEGVSENKIDEILSKTEDSISKISVGSKVIFENVDEISFFVSVYLSNTGAITGNLNDDMEYLNIIIEYTTV